MRRVSIIGMGRMGRALALSLPRAGYELDRLFVRDDRRDLPAELVQFASKFGETERVDPDVVFITTRDNEIEAAASALSEKVAARTIVFHTSGSRSSTALAAVKAVGCSVGSLHPLVSVSDPSL